MCTADFRLEVRLGDTVSTERLSVDSQRLRLLDRRPNRGTITEGFRLLGLKLLIFVCSAYFDAYGKLTEKLRPWWLKSSYW